MPRPTATTVLRGRAEGATDRLTLDYEARFLRRRTLTTDAGEALLIDLPETVSLNDGDALATADGRLIAIRAAPEPLLQVLAPPHELPRLAWHIGNRHKPAQIEPQRILIQPDHVLADMLTRLGATVAEVLEPFRPEGGAYGPGRTLGHSHAPHDHAPDHTHDPH
jgi:urease accessory protein